MKRILILLTGICFALTSRAQVDSTKTQTDSTRNESDTIRVGTMIIIKKGGHAGNDEEVTIHRRHSYKPQNLTTNWFILDFGFNQVNDQTNYAQAIANGFLPAGATSDWFNQRNGKSVNVNIWPFMQRLNLIKHVVNLNYGIGIELNNYRYTNNIVFQRTKTPLVLMDTISFSKNKLAADYLTVPVMLNFNLTPQYRRGFGLSVGMSFGYLYSSRQKTVSAERGKNKFHDSFDLNTWKVSYIAELNLGPVRVYGSYATNSMFKNALDQTPYNFGIRLSSW
jgi:hypothetical protein